MKTMRSILVLLLLLLSIARPSQAQDVSADREIIDYNIKGNVVEYRYVTATLSEKNIISESAEKISDNRYRFYSGQQFKIVGGVWRQVEYATTTATDFQAPSQTWFIIRRALAQAVFTSFDGSVSCAGMATWADARTCSSPTADNSSANDYVWQSSFSGGLYYNGRGIFHFDTSPLSSGTVSSATLNLWVTGRSNADSFTQYIVDVSSVASNSTISASDYPNIGTTEYSSLLASSANLNAYNTFTLNTAGRAEIDVNGYSTFGFITSLDKNNSSPTGVNRLVLDLSETAGTNHDPYLDVTMATSSGTSLLSSNASSTPDSIAMSVLGLAVWLAFSAPVLLIIIIFLIL